MSNLKYKLLVFDWDGTLMDSAANIIGCVQGAIKRIDAPSRSDDEIRNIIGLGLREAIATLFPDCTDAFVADLAAAYRDIFLTQGYKESELFPDVEETLHWLNDKGYFLTVATGKGRAGLTAVLETTGLESLFFATRCVDDAPSKPHPEMIHQLMGELAVDPCDTLMIGDTEFDLEMARSAGTRSIGVSYGAHSVDRLLKHEPITIIDNIKELKSWL